MRIIELLGLAIVVSCSSGCATYENKLPEEAANAIHSARNVIIYSLEPLVTNTNNDSYFHGYKILGQTALDGKQAKIAIAAFESAISKRRPNITWACFEPRHALRVNDAGQTYDFLLCYACGYLDVYHGDNNIAELSASGSPNDLNAILMAAHIPLSKSAD